MSETAATKLRRILALIPKIADDEEHSVDEIAEQLGVPPKVLLQDLLSLAERFDEPGGFVAGLTVNVDDKWVSAHTSHFLRPMRLTMRELCALELGLALLRRESTPDEWPAIDRAQERLRAAITRLPANELLDGVHHAELGAAGTEHLPALRRAVEAHRKATIRYHAGSDEQATTRTICPYALVFSHGMWYVAALCERSEGLRFFRLDRIEMVEPTDSAFALPDDVSVDAFVREKVLAHAGTETMTVRYSASIARWIAEREGVIPAADGSLTLEHPLADRGWAIRHVLQYGPDAEVLEPAELREAIVERLREVV